MCELCQPSGVKFNSANQCLNCRDTFTPQNPAIPSFASKDGTWCYQCVITKGEHHSERFAEEP